MPNESEYYFRGGKFVENYINPKKFKIVLKEKIDYSLGDELKETEHFGEFYKKIILQQPKNQVDEILFDHVFYGQLKHIYVHQLSNKEGIKVPYFNQNIKKLIENFDSDAIPAELKRKMKPNGFLLLDQLNITKNNVYFIAGLHPIIENEIVVKFRILLGKTYLYEGKNNEGKIKYMLAGIDCDFREGLCLVLVHNGSEVPSDENDERQVSSPASFHNYIGKKVFPLLNISTYIFADNDREGMFNYCKEMLDIMFSESRGKINEELESEIKKFGSKTKKILGRIGEEKPDQTTIDNLVRTIETILLGIYIRTNLTNDDELRHKARKLELPGYPTRIHYKNASANKSSTGTSSAKTPIHQSETLYSLYTDFGNSNRLEEWSMAWFTNSDPKELLDVVRTNIVSTQSYFKVHFTATRHLDERIIYHVVRTLNSRRI